MFSMQHFGQIADIAHFHFFSFSTATGLVSQIDTTFKSGETCCTASHVLTNLNIGGPTKIAYSLFRTNYEILLPTAG